jgi:hypothetical protein
MFRDTQIVLPRGSYGVEVRNGFIHRKVSSIYYDRMLLWVSFGFLPDLIKGDVYSNYDSACEIKLRE